MDKLESIERPSEGKLDMKSLMTNIILGDTSSLGSLTPECAQELQEIMMNTMWERSKKEVGIYDNAIKHLASRATLNKLPNFNMPILEGAPSLGEMPIIDFESYLFWVDGTTVTPIPKDDNKLLELVDFDPFTKAFLKTWAIKVPGRHGLASTLLDRASMDNLVSWISTRGGEVDEKLLALVDYLGDKMPERTRGLLLQMNEAADALFTQSPGDIVEKARDRVAVETPKGTVEE